MIYLMYFNRFRYFSFRISYYYYCTKKNNIPNKDITKELRKPYGYWRDINNQREFLESIRNQVGVRTLNDWKHIKIKEIIKYGGGSLLRLYPSYLDAIKTIYPDIHWNEHDFKSISSSSKFYSSIDNQRLFFDTLCESLHLKSPIELSKLSSKEIRLKGFIFLLYHLVHSFTD